MNPNPSFSSTLPAPDATIVAARLIAAIATALIGVQLLVTPARAQGAGYDDENAEVMTRGPVHEAFATVVDYNPGRGFVTEEPPPDPIDELPPVERPEGEDVAWIPGYWAWDDEQSDYIWVSGTWRVPPPGREWVPGYWSDSGGEFLWISGYWAEMEARETTYLPPPPESLESGPNVEPPSDDYRWTPGCWIWHDGRYAWRPGFWDRGRGDWIWIPSYYVWTPHGYVFIDGYWDYEVRRRGVVYAPVHFRSRVYARRDYHYSPTIVFNLGLFSDHLFVRPRWSHYYFGDYYAPRYESAGFYFTFSYYSSWRGYDPFYSHWRWEHRRDRDWDRRYQASYRYRRDNEAARPPRTWSAQVAIASSTTIATENRIIVAGTTSQLRSTRDYPVKFRRVEEAERRTLLTSNQDIRVARDQRRTTESRLERAEPGRSREVAEPRKVERPKSPIASRPQRELPRNLTPPKAPNSPKVDLNATAKGSGRPDAGARDRGEQPRQGTSADTRRRSDREPETRRDNARSAAEERGRAADSARSGSQREAQRKEGAARSHQGPTGERPGNAEDDAARARMDAQALSRREAETRARNETEAQSNREASQREQAAKAKEQNEARQKAAAAEKRKDQQSQERRAKEEKEPRAERGGQAQFDRESETRARSEAQARAEREASQREQTAKAKAQADARAKAADAQSKSQRQAAERRAKETADSARQQEAQAQARKSAEAREQREAQARARQESESRAKREAQAQAQARKNAEARQQREAQAKAGQESEARAKREAQAQAQARAKREASQREQVARARAQEEAQARARADSQARERQQAAARTGEAQTAARRESANQPSKERTQQSKQPPPKQQKRAADDDEDSKNEKGKGRP